VSFEKLRKNFGGDAGNRVLEKPVDSNAGTHFDTINDSTMCAKCGGKHLWRHKGKWFCAKCRRPPTIDFIEAEHGATSLLRDSFPGGSGGSNVIEESRSRPIKPTGKLIASQCNWSRDVCCQVPGCVCRMVTETVFSDDSHSLNCFICGEVSVPELWSDVNEVGV